MGILIQASVDKDAYVDREAHLNKEYSTYKDVWVVI